MGLCSEHPNATMPATFVGISHRVAACALELLWWQAKRGITRQSGQQGEFGIEEIWELGLLGDSSEVARAR
jgi:hypothetical protein